MVGITDVTSGGDESAFLSPTLTPRVFPSHHRVSQVIQGIQSGYSTDHPTHSPPKNTTLISARSKTERDGVLQGRSVLSIIDDRHA